MNRQTDNERLLADVLTPEADPGFSATLLAETLHRARRRRRVRQLRRYGGALAVLLAVATLISSYILRRTVTPELAQLPQPLSYHLVVSQPLAPSQRVSTQPLARSQLVAPAATHEVRTAPGGFREVGDDELMALAAPRVVALVRRGPHEAELVFVASPPEDSDSRQN